MKEYVFSDSDLSESIRQNLSGQGIRDDFYVVFLSICNTVERASVFTGTGNTIENAWASAEKQAVAYVKQNKFDLVWAKADVVDSMEWAPTTILNEYVYSTMYQNFFRKGLALDEDFSVAFLESEISGNKLITYYSESDVSAKRIDYEANLLHLNNINYYLKNWRKEGAIPSTPDQIILFTTQGFFCEKDGGVLPLYNEGMNTGRRMLSPGPDHFTPTVLSASEYLYNLIEPDGKFVYGYYPVFDNWMTGYNIVRHASSLWSLINLYRMTHDDTYIKGIDQGMEYLVDCIAYQNADTAYLVEYKVDEIKLGGNGVAIIAMSEYMDVFSSDKYLALVEHLANGILALQDQDTGAYYHVLNYPDFSRKEAVRTVYYDGEATFALARAYSFTGMEKYLDGAQLAVEYFIRNDYTRYRDHWIAYSLHEVTKYIPEPRYFQFALANVEKNLDRIYNQTTSYHTYLELLAISWQTYQRILDNGIAVDGLDAFDAEYFAQALYRRASYMLNSFFYPEYAMYMKVPRDALGTFFVRHDSFRIRIDDIQHFIGGYYYFLKNYDTIRPWLSEAFLEEMHAEGGRFADTPGMDSEIGEDVEASDIEANG
ncbi:MAG: glycosyl hydrolase family 88 [Clostridiales bacterium]|nr:glycosyl hydrolase family 88 [Clostridiales bacterium]